MDGRFPAPPIAKALGFSMSLVEHGRVTFDYEPVFDHYNPLGSVHGGVAATLLDSVMGCCIHTTLKPGFGFTTLEIKVNYVRAMLDTNFHFRTEGFRRIAEAVGPTRLTWLELDAHDPKSIALIRRDSPVPIASGETLLERRDFRPYFESYAFDTAIVDVVWNGFYESLKIAAMADVYEVNVAPHNFYGHLASAISAHFCAAVPNFRIMN